MYFPIGRHGEGAVSEVLRFVTAPSVDAELLRGDDGGGDGGAAVSG